MCKFGSLPLPASCAAGLLQLRVLLAQPLLGAPGPLLLLPLSRSRHWYKKLARDAQPPAKLRYVRGRRKTAQHRLPKLLRVLALT